jgi:hypothetical protein
VKEQTINIEKMEGRNKQTLNRGWKEQTIKRRWKEGIDKH